MKKKPIDLSTNKIVTRKDEVFNEIYLQFFEQTNHESVSISPELIHESEDEQLTVNLNQESYYEDHSEQSDIQTIMDILNVLTQQQ